MIHDIDLRRLFRNRFIRLVDPNLIEVSVIPDGSHLSLFEICEQLQHDDEPMPRALWKDVNRFVGTYRWMNRFAGPSYGEVARLVLGRTEYLRSKRSG